MGVNRTDLFEVVCVRVHVARRSVRVARVVHARSEVRVVEVLVMMVETEVVGDFLTHDETAPCGSVISRGIEIRVIQFRVRLGDVLSAGDPESIDARADDSQDLLCFFECGRGCQCMIAPRAKIFAVSAVEITLHGHIIDCQSRRQREVTPAQFDQVVQIDKHAADYKTRRLI